MYICRSLGGGDSTLCYVGQYFQSDPRIWASLFMCKRQYLCVRREVGGGRGVKAAKWVMHRDPPPLFSILCIIYNRPLRNLFSAQMFSCVHLKFTFLLLHLNLFNVT